MSLAATSGRKNIGAFVVVLAILVAGTWTAVKIATDRLLYQDATSTAQGWAMFLAASRMASRALMVIVVPFVLRTSSLETRLC